MTHVELLFALTKKLPRLNREDGEILKNIVSGIAQKNDSIFRFYEELTTSNGILNLQIIKKTSENYSVPKLYGDLIDNRFKDFKMNIISVCAKNKQRIADNKNPGYDESKWMKSGQRMFSSTETTTIEKAGGLENMCISIHTIGYFDFLRKIFLESATEVSRAKYSKLIQSGKNAIAYKEE